jgi:hypothetical protein
MASKLWNDHRGKQVVLERGEGGQGHHLKVLFTITLL